MSVTVTVRLESGLEQRLERLSEETQRSKPFLVAEAIRDYVDLNEWQVQEIGKAVAEADRGEFANDELIGKVFSKWEIGAGDKCPTRPAPRSRALESRRVPP